MKRVTLIMKRQTDTVFASFFDDLNLGFFPMTKPLAGGHISDKKSRSCIGKLEKNCKAVHLCAYFVLDSVHKRTPVGVRSQVKIKGSPC